MERPGTFEGSPYIAIATELRQKTEAAKPFVESAKQDVGIISSRAEGFLAETTPDNFRSFISPLLRPEEDDSIAIANKIVTDTVAIWRQGIYRERGIMTLLEDTGLPVVSADNLKKAVEILEREQENLNKGRFSAITTRTIRRRRVSTIKQQLTRTKNYLTLYDATVGPLVTTLTETRGTVDNAVNSVVNRLDEFGRQEPYSKPPKVEEEISKEETLDKLEEQWLEGLITTPLKEIEELLIANRRKASAVYTSIDETVDRSNFAQLREAYIQYVKSRTDSKPRTPREWVELTQRWRQEDNEEITAGFGAIILGSASGIERTFIDLGLEREYRKMADRLTRYGDEAVQIMHRGYSWQPEDEMLDLRPRIAYLRWARLIDNFQPPTPEWIFPELNQASWRNQSLMILSNAVDGLPKRKPEYRDDIQSIPAEELTRLPSFDRWIILKTYLQDQDFVPQERLDAFEDALILKMVNQVLISGGKESWPGTTVTQILRKLGSPRALVPLLYYQTYISGASGLYSAGHTNAAAQASFRGDTSRN